HACERTLEGVSIFLNNRTQPRNYSRRSPTFCAVRLSSLKWMQRLLKLSKRICLWLEPTFFLTRDTPVPRGGRAIQKPLRCLVDFELSKPQFSGTKTRDSTESKK